MTQIKFRMTTRNPAKRTLKGAPKSELRIKMEGMRLSDVLHIELPMKNPSEAIRLSQRVNSLCTQLSGWSPKMIRYRWQLDEVNHELVVRRES